MIDYEVRGPVALITIRRPEARNAVNGEVARGIEDALDRLEAADDVWARVLTGDPITAERAYELGMVNQLVEPGQAVEAALAAAERIAANAPLAVQASRRVALHAATADDDTLWRESVEAFAAMAATEDFQEG